MKKKRNYITFIVYQLVWYLARTLLTTLAAIGSAVWCWNWSCQIRGYSCSVGGEIILLPIVVGVVWFVGKALHELHFKAVCELRRDKRRDDRT